jgi:hypothetical protein
MRVALGTFVRSGVEAHFGSEAKAGIEAALRHYTRRLKSSRPPVAVPVFSRKKGPTSQDGEAFDLAVGPEIEEALTREARRQGVPTNLLLTHAVLIYLADLDANLGESRASPVEEDAALPRYQRRCAPDDAELPAAARRHVGSA